MPILEVHRDTPWLRGMTALLLAAICAPASATHTVCDFYARDGYREYAFEFVGTDDIAMIQINAPRGARLGDYRIEVMDPDARRVRVIHVASAVESTLASFVLEGVGDTVRLRFADRELSGRLNCDALLGP